MRLTVPLLRLVAMVSGIGSEENEDVVLAEECRVVAKCCPLDSAGVS